MQRLHVINHVCSLVIQVPTGTTERAFGDHVLSGPGQASNMPRLQNPIQDLHGGDLGLEHQAPYSVPQLLQGSQPQEVPTAYVPAAPPTSQAVESDPISQVTSFNSSNACRQRHSKHAPVRHDIVGKCAPLTLDHHIFTKDKWTPVHLRDHPRVPITISIDTSAQTRYSTPNRTSITHAEVSIQLVFFLYFINFY